MKKISLGFVIIILLVSILSGCITYSMKVDSPVENEGNVSIEIKSIVQEKTLGWWALLIPITPTKSQGLELLITNNTDKPQSINWNQSSLNWHGRSSSIFMSGGKYSQAGEGSIPNTAVGVGKSVKVTIYPSTNVDWTGKEWKINGMNLKKGDEISLIAFTESGLQIETTYEVEQNDGIRILW